MGILKKSQPGVLERVMAPGTTENVLARATFDLFGQVILPLVVEEVKDRRLQRRAAEKRQQLKEMRKLLKKLWPDLSPEERREYTERIWAHYEL